MGDAVISFALFAAWATFGLHAASQQWATLPDPCAHTYVAAIVNGGTPLAGNFALSNGDCVVWVNASKGPLRPRDVCKLIVHEVGHLRGLQHSPDPRNVMYSPFRSNPRVQGCGRRRPRTRDA